MIKHKQIGGVHIKAALPKEFPNVVDLQAGCSFSLLTLDQLIELRAAIDRTILEVRESKQA